MDIHGTEVAALVPAGQPLPQTGDISGIRFDPPSLHLMDEA
jgi:hypothetical protein